jgi:hypothetical protein
LLQDFTSLGFTLIGYNDLRHSILAFQQLKDEISKAVDAATPGVDTSSVAVHYSVSLYNTLGNPNVSPSVGGSVISSRAVSPKASSPRPSTAGASASANTGANTGDAVVVTMIDETKVQINNIPSDQSIAAIKCVCQSYGQLRSCRVVEVDSKDSDHGTQNVIVEYHCASDGKYAISVLSKSADQIWSKASLNDTDSPTAPATATAPAPAPASAVVSKLSLSVTPPPPAAVDTVTTSFSYFSTEYVSMVLRLHNLLQLWYPTAAPPPLPLPPIMARHSSASNTVPAGIPASATASATASASASVAAPTDVTAKVVPSPPTINIPVANGTAIRPTNPNLAAAAEFLSPKYSQQEIIYQQQQARQRQLLEQQQQQAADDGNATSPPVTATTSVDVATVATDNQESVVEANVTELEAGAIDFQYAGSYMQHAQQQSYEQQMLLFQQQQQRLMGAAGAPTGAVMAPLEFTTVNSTGVISPPAELSPEQHALYLQQMQMQMQMQNHGAYRMHYNHAPPQSIPTHHLHNYSGYAQEMYHQMNNVGRAGMQQHPEPQQRYSSQPLHHHGGKQAGIDHRYRTNQHQQAHLYNNGDGSGEMLDNVVNFDNILSGEDKRLTVMVRFYLFIYMSALQPLLAFTVIDYIAICVSLSLYCIDSQHS